MWKTEAALLTASVLSVCSLPLDAIAATCNVPLGTDPILCYETGSYPIVILQVPVSSPGLWEFVTSDLKNLPGQSNTVNPMMWVLDNNGGVLAIDNDSGGGFAPRIDRSFSAATGVIVVIAGFTDDRQGSLDFTLRKSGTTGTTWNDLWFGGWRRVDLRIESGDRMFVGYPRGATMAGIPGNALLTFSSSLAACSSGCGQYQIAGWPVGTLSAVSTGISTATGSVIVGSWYQSSIQGTRWFHSRLGAAWGSSTSFNDVDCDGLTREIEALSSTTNPNLHVHTCESAVVPFATDCGVFSARSSWLASDTDNDGLRDDWELYGVRKRCERVPSQPDNHPGACYDDTWRYTRSGVPCGLPSVPSTYTVTNGLSSLGIAPDEYSVLVEYAGPTGSPFTGDAVSFIERVYQEEGLECQETTDPGCAPPTQDYIDIVLQSASLPQMGVLAEPPFYSIVAGHFNEYFSPSRKHTGTFHYASRLLKNG